MKTFAQPGVLQANHVILTEGKNLRAKRLFASDQFSVHQRLRRGIPRCGSE